MTTPTERFQTMTDDELADRALNPPQDSEARAALRAEIDRRAAVRKKLGVAAVSSIPRTHVVVTDIQMPFGSMVVFMVKWALAAIPAGLMLLIPFYFLLAMFAAALHK